RHVKLRERGPLTWRQLALELEKRHQGLETLVDQPIEVPLPQVREIAFEKIVVHLGELLDRGAKRRLELADELVGPGLNDHGGVRGELLGALREEIEILGGIV